MARLYSNENFPRMVVEELRRLGHDVLTVFEIGLAGIGTPDEQVLSSAVSQRRAVLTLNRRHFIKLHREQPAHEGIVVCTADDDFLGQAARIHAILEATPNLAGQLLRVYRPQ